MDKVNYCVAHYWKRNGQTCDTLRHFKKKTFNTPEVHTGTMREAQGWLAYAKEQEPEQDWQLFVLSSVASF